MVPAIRSSKFDLPLTYDAGSFSLQVGDVVRIPLGPRETLGFVVSPVRASAPPEKIRTVAERLNVPRAFDQTGLHLARFIAAYYVCTLGEALSAVVLAQSLPRVVDTLYPTGERPADTRVPTRLIDLIWTDFANGFALDALLRHPEARRVGDRAALLRHVGNLSRAGQLRRERRFDDPRMHEYRIKTLWPVAERARGKTATALLAFVRDRPGLPRADAILAGFSSAAIARCVKAAVVREEDVAPARQRSLQEPMDAPFSPTGEQASALQAIGSWVDAGAFHEALLHGITGSGKTFVYVEAIKRVLARGERAIVLVPEISLTPQTAGRFEAAFGARVAVLHSALSERERFDAWQACMRGDVDVVVGARSAVFAPLKDVRLIVVDESHESSYKQESVPRYHAVTVARERMRRAGGVLLLGSATPSIESYAAAAAGRISRLELLRRATQAPLPAVRVVDLAKEFEGGNRGTFSAALVQGIASRLERREKVVLFVNRRGTAAFVLCRSCGHVPLCVRCSVSLSVHRNEGVLRCHYCDFQVRVPHRCPACGGDAIREFGIGTQRVAEDVAGLFPGAQVVRMDSDTTTRIGDHARRLSEFATGGDVLVGTQMVAKGLDFPDVTLVGVVAADMGLHIADFRASERTFALIAQACGRSGRAGAGEAIVQTYAPSHPAIVHAATHDYHGFAARELDERRVVGYPPARRLAYVGVISRVRDDAWNGARRYANLLREAGMGDVLGPAPYPIERLNNEWRYRIAVKAVRPSEVRRVLREAILPLAHRDRSTRVAINIDP